MTGDEKPVVAMPLTNGFARTGYELEEAQAQAEAVRRGALSSRSRECGDRTVGLKGCAVWGFPESSGMRRHGEHGYGFALSRSVNKDGAGVRHL